MIDWLYALLIIPVPSWALVTVGIVVWCLTRNTDRDSRTAWYWRSYR